MAKADVLTPREEVFVAAYIARRFNGKQAAIDAGHPAKGAAVQATRYLDRSKVQEAIARRVEQQTRTFKLSGAKVLEEMCVIAFSDIRHYAISDTGHVELTGGAPDSAYRAVKKIKRKRREIPQGKDEPPIVEHETEIELWSKDQQLRNLGEHLGLFREPKDGEKPGEQLTREQREARVREIVRKGAARAKEAKA